MKTAKLHLLLLTFCILFSLPKATAQNWLDTWQHENNFYTVQDSFNAYALLHLNQEDADETNVGEKEEGEMFPGYEQYKRWEAFVAPRVYPSGDLSLLTNSIVNYNEFIQQRNSQRNGSGNQTASTPWVAMGPFGPLTGVATNGLPRKAGRINFITYLPGSPNTYWVGAAAGGLWKTIDNGQTWTTPTDYLSSIGCNDLAIDPTDPNTMYLATGDGYGSFRDPSTFGILKSIDGGQNWSATGLTFPLSQKVEMRHIIINPINPLIVMCSTSSGIYRNANGGTGAWTNVQATNTFDLEYKPGSTDTIYAGGVRFRRSIDGGLTFQQISTGIPTSGSSRMEIAVTPANPIIVYVVSAATSTLGLQGVYRSTDGGTTFTLMANTPDVVASDCFITSTSGQGWYNLSIDASPTNANEIVVGGLGVWKSTDAGVTWAGIGCAYNWSSPVPYVHTDHQELEYTAAGILYSANDGGIFEYTGTQWIDHSSPMNIAQIYKIGLSELSPDLWITGHQDNGSNIYNNGVYSASLAADGGDCFIDRTNNQNMFASITNGQFYKSTNGGGSWNSCVTGLPVGSGWMTPWKQDPTTAGTLYAGRAQMYVSTNQASTWAATPGLMSPVVANQYITEFAIAPSNNQYIYAIHGTTGVFTTTNAGTTWTLCSGLPTTLASASFVTIDPVNPLIAWVTFSGYSNGNKVFKTIDGGVSWLNISYNLPNIPANCSVFERGSSNGAIYVGMDAGVYYIDNSTSTWTLFNTALPNTPILDMEISAAAPTKIRAATYGRGVYQTDLGISTGVVQNADGLIYFNIYPNPSSDILHVNLNSSMEINAELEITNTIGELILKKHAQFADNNSEVSIDISSLAKGIYFFRIVSSEGDSKAIKFIKL
ncbi:hypothetical protein BH09BAC5_BH09BAC5_13470 [soil metagenome]